MKLRKTCKFEDIREVAIFLLSKFFLMADFVVKHNLVNQAGVPFLSYVAHIKTIIFIYPTFFVDHLCSFPFMLVVRTF